MNTLDEAQPLWDKLLAIVHDEHATDIELDVVALLLAFEGVEWRAAWGEEKCLELELTLNGEVLHGEVVLPVVRQGLVESSVLLVGDLLGLAHPQWLVLVQLFPIVGDLLLLLLLGFVNLLDLRLVTLLTLFLLLLLVLLRVSHLLLVGLLDVELDRETDELGVLLDQVLKAALLQELGLVLLERKDDLRTTLDVAVGPDQ